MHPILSAVIRQARPLRYLFWAALLFTLVMALLPLPPQEPGQSYDKVQHILAFVALTVMGRAAYLRSPWSPLLIGLAIFGALIEFAQMIPVLERDPELLDWIVDCAAVGATALILHFFVRGLARP